MSSAKKELHAALVREVRRMVANSVLFNTRMAEALKVNPTDLQFINLLEIHGPLTPGKLAQLTGLTTGGVTVVLDRLEQAGVIRRAPNPSDRRSSIIYVSAKFLRTAQVAYSEMGRATDMLFGEFSEKELAVVLAFLKKANDIRV
jgi:MarR family transcriptional regulator, organic hydroperoxide resistance regulator